MAPNHLRHTCAIPIHVLTLYLMNVLHYEKINDVLLFHKIHFIPDVSFATRISRRSSDHYFNRWGVVTKSGWGAGHCDNDWMILLEGHNRTETDLQLVCIELETRYELIVRIHSLPARDEQYVRRRGERYLYSV